MTSAKSCRALLVSSVHHASHHYLKLPDWSLVQKALAECCPTLAVRCWHGKPALRFGSGQRLYPLIAWQVLAEGADVTVNTTERMGGLKKKHKKTPKHKGKMGNLSWYLWNSCELIVFPVPRESSSDLCKPHTSSANTKDLTNSSKHQPELEGNCFCWTAIIIPAVYPDFDK